MFKSWRAKCTALEPYASRMEAGTTNSRGTFATQKGGGWDPCVSASRRTSWVMHKNDNKTCVKRLLARRRSSSPCMHSPIHAYNDSVTWNGPDVCVTPHRNGDHRHAPSNEDRSALEHRHKKSSGTLDNWEPYRGKCKCSAPSIFIFVRRTWFLAPKGD